jgi:hypothetical protein
MIPTEKMNRRRSVLSRFLSGMLCMLAFSPDSASASDPVEEHIIPLYQQTAPATVLLSSVYVSEHPTETPSNSGVGSGFI